MLVRVKVTEVHIQEMEIEADDFESARVQFVSLFSLEPTLRRRQLVAAFFYC